MLVLFLGPTRLLGSCRFGPTNPQTQHVLYTYKHICMHIKLHACILMSLKLRFSQSKYFIELHACILMSLVDLGSGFSLFTNCCLSSIFYCLCIEVPLCCRNTLLERKWTYANSLCFTSAGNCQVWLSTWIYKIRPVH